MIKIRNIFSLIIKKTSLVLTFLMLALLTYLVTGVVQHIDLMTYEDMPVLYLWNAPVKIIFVVLLALATSGLTLLLYNYVSSSKSTQIACTIACIISLIPCTIFGIWWIITDEIYITGDAGAVAAMAKAIAHGEDLAGYAYYFNIYANQRGIVLLEAIFYKLFNDNAYIIMRSLNLVMIISTVQVLSLIAYEIWNSRKAMFLTRILLAVFLPFILFTNLVYGTVPSIFLVILGFLFALKLYREDRTVYAVFSVLCFTLAMFIYQGAIIAVLATVIYLIFIERKFPSMKIGITALVLILSLLFTGKLTGLVFSAVTGLELSKGLPAIAWIYMGISADSGVNGAGSYNRAHVVAYELNNNDSESTSRYCVQQIIQIIREYLNGQRSLFFFYEKTRCQWTNSLFDATQVTQYPMRENFDIAASYRQLLSGGFMFGLLLFSDILQMLIYVFAFLWLIKSIFKKDIPPKAFLLIIYFIGGFLFQLIWEQKARYCMPYFMILIPLAACELASLSSIITSRNHKDL